MIFIILWRKSRNDKKKKTLTTLNSEKTFRNCAYLKDWVCREN